MLCRDLSGLYYPFLGVRTTHHPASHDDRSEGYARIAQFYCSQAAYLAGRLDAMKEGEGSVLDNSCVLFLSNMWSGKSHDNNQVPLVTAGSLGGTLETGRVLDYLNAGDSSRRLCSLYLSLMAKMGVKLDHFGDAHAPLAEV
jgi:hypothetical protein